MRVVLNGEKTETSGRLITPWRATQTVQRGDIYDERDMVDMKPKKPSFSDTRQVRISTHHRITKGTNMKIQCTTHRSLCSRHGPLEKENEHG